MHICTNYFLNALQIVAKKAERLFASSIFLALMYLEIRMFYFFIV